MKKTQPHGLPHAWRNPKGAAACAGDPPGGFCPPAPLPPAPGGWRGAGGAQPRRIPGAQQGATAAPGTGRPAARLAAPRPHRSAPPARPRARPGAQTPPARPRAPLPALRRRQRTWFPRQPLAVKPSRAAARRPLRRLEERGRPSAVSPPPPAAPRGRRSGGVQAGARSLGGGRPVA